MATIPSIPTIQLFRNSIIKTGRQAAIDALEAQKASVADGGLILARYSEDGTDNGVKTLLGIVRNGGGTNVQLTIIDVEGAAKNVQSAIEKAINDLNKADNAVDGQYVSSVSEDKGIITVTRKPLPSFDEKTDSGKAITAITQTNGEVSVKFGGVAAANVSVADSTGKFDSDNVEGALLEIKTSLDNAIGTGGTVAEQISNAINDLDSSATSENNYFDVTVAQENGKITSLTVTNKDIASAALLGKKEDASTAETAFGRIAKEAADRKAAIEALSTSSTVTLESAEGTESGVLKVYTIKQGGSEVGKINIPKDLVVTSGSVVKGTWNDGTFTEEESGDGTALKLVIANQTAPVYINTLDLVKDHTAGNGIAISNTNEISVRIDGDTERFLTVETNGIKLSGVQAAINAAAASATTKVEKTDGGSHITVTSSKSNSDSSVTYTISESDIASATDLTTETNNRTKADKELADKLGTGVSTAATETVTAQLQALSGTSESLSGDTSVKGAKKYTDGKIEALSLTQVGGNGQVITTISQTDGKVSVTAATLGAENVSASPIDSGNATVAVTGTNVSAQISSLAKSIKTVNVDVSEQLANYYTKNYIDENYWDIDTTGRYVDATVVDELNKINVEVESTTESTPETTTTQAIKIVQASGRIESITLGAFDCGTY